MTVCGESDCNFEYNFISDDPTYVLMKQIHSALLLIFRTQIPPRVARLCAAGRLGCVSEQRRVIGCGRCE